jgi:hypothetical protein
LLPMNIGKTESTGSKLRQRRTDRFNDQKVCSSQ